MAGLEDPRTTQQRTDGVRRLRALVEPVVGPLGFEIRRRIPLTRNVLADDLDEPPVARTLRVGYDDTIGGGLFPPGSAETNANHVTLLSGLLRYTRLFAHWANPSR